MGKKLGDERWTTGRDAAPTKWRLHEEPGCEVGLTEQTILRHEPRKVDCGKRRGKVLGGGIVYEVGYMFIYKLSGVMGFLFRISREGNICRAGERES